ncbi:MAG: hypothetical protein P9M03_11500 [Candidatus Theseobacter exili]|nr:hypothetical protein [Candidatus Theseobacter exili]
MTYSQDPDNNYCFFLYYDITENLNDNEISQLIKDIDIIIVNKMGLNPQMVNCGDAWGEIRFQLLSDSIFNRPIINHLSERGWNDPRLLHQQKVRNFIQATKDTLAYMVNRPSGRNISIIYKDILQGINEIVNIHSGNRFIIIYSDLLENNPNGLSFIQKSYLTNADANTIRSDVKKEYRISFPVINGNSIKIYVIRPSHQGYQDERIIIEDIWNEIYDGSIYFQNTLNLH